MYLFVRGEIIFFRNVDMYVCYLFVVFNFIFVLYRLLLRVQIVFKCHALTDAHGHVHDVLILNLLQIIFIYSIYGLFEFLRRCSSKVAFFCVFKICTLISKHDHSNYVQRDIRLQSVILIFFIL